MEVTQSHTHLSLLFFFLQWRGLRQTYHRLVERVYMHTHTQEHAYTHRNTHILHIHTNIASPGAQPLTCSYKDSHLSETVCFIIIIIFYYYYFLQLKRLPSFCTGIFHFYYIFSAAKKTPMCLQGYTCYCYYFSSAKKTPIFLQGYILFLSIFSAAKKTPIFLHGYTCTHTYLTYTHKHRHTWWKVCALWMSLEILRGSLLWLLSEGSLVQLIEYFWFQVISLEILRGSLLSEGSLLLSLGLRGGVLGLMR